MIKRRVLLALLLPTLLLPVASTNYEQSLDTPLHVHVLRRRDH